MIPNLIGLIGRAGAGKDTFAAALAPLGYQRVAFADALKASAYSADPLVELAPYGPVRRLSYVVDAVGWDDAKTRYPDVRRFLQRHGVAMRDAVPGCWVDIARRKIDALIAAGNHVVVTDVRFADEVAMIQQADGLVVSIHRPGAGLAGDNAAHVSETGVDTFIPDMLIANTGTLDDLARDAEFAHRVATGSRNPQPSTTEALMRAFR